MENSRAKSGSEIQLFSDDKNLPGPAKKRCIKAVTVDTLANSKSLFPASELFQNQVRAIDGVNQFESPIKDTAWWPSWLPISLFCEEILRS